MLYRRVLLSVAAWAALLVNRSAGAEPPARVDLRGDPLPPGAIARLGADRLHPGACVCVLSPDGKTLATAGDALVRLWDMQTGKELRAVPCPRAVSFKEIVYSPDGRLFAAAVGTMGVINNPGWDEDVVYLGETGTGKVRLIKKDPGAVCSLSFSRDGTVLAACLLGLRKADRSQDTNIVLWNADSGEELRRYSGVGCFALSPDGKFIAGGEPGGAVHLWNVAEGEELRIFKRHQAPVLALAFSPDGKTLASAGGQDNRFLPAGKKAEDTQQDTAVRLWDVKTGEERRRCPGHEAPVERLVFAPDGRTLLSIDAGQALRVWDAASGSARLSISGENDNDRRLLFGNRNYRRAAFSPDARTLVWGDRDGIVHEWSIGSGKETRQWDADQHWCWGFSFTPDGKTLMCAGDPLRLWDVAAGKERFGTQGHESAVIAVRFSPNGKAIASMDSDLHLRLWDASAGKAAPLPASAGRAQMRFAFSADGKTLAAVGRDLTLRVCETATGKELHSADIGTDALRAQEADFAQEGLEDELRRWADSAIAVSPNGTRLAVSDELHVIHVWDAGEAKELCQLKSRQGRTYRMAFFPDGKKLISQAGSDIRIWDAEKGEELRRFSDEPGREPFFALSADGATLAWGAGVVVHLWDAAGDKKMGDLGRHEALISSVALSRDGRLLASLDEHEIVRLWDVVAGKCLQVTSDDGKEFSFHSVELIAAPGSQLVAKASEDGMNTRYGLRDLQSGRDLHVLAPCDDEQFAFAPDGRTLAVGTAEVALLDAASGKERCWLPPGHRGHLTALAFSPDGKTLATGGSDGNVLLWDVSGLKGDGPPQLFHLSDAELKSLWDSLDSDEAAVAQHQLIGSVQEVLPFLRARLRTVPQVDPRTVARWVAALDDDDFDAREKATRELEKIGKLAEWDLRDALRGEPSPELRRRAEFLLGRCKEDSSLPPESLRALRAIGVLEHLATPEAKDTLQELAHGSPGAWLTRQAAEALKRQAAIPTP